MPVSFAQGHPSTAALAPITRSGIRHICTAERYCRAICKECSFTTAIAVAAWHAFSFRSFLTRLLAKVGWARGCQTWLGLHLSFACFDFVASLRSARTAYSWLANSLSLLVLRNFTSRNLMKLVPSSSLFSVDNLVILASNCYWSHCSLSSPASSNETLASCSWWWYSPLLFECWCLRYSSFRWASLLMVSCRLGC